MPEGAQTSFTVCDASLLYRSDTVIAVKK